MYQSDWTPFLGEILQCSREVSNAHDPFAIKVTKDGNVVGHLPKKISSTCSLFIRNGGIIYCEVTDPNRRYSRDLVQGGLEIPCVITLQGTRDLIEKATKLLALSDMKIVIPVTELEVVPAPLKAGTMDANSDSSLVIPPGKKIKVEPTEPIVEVEQDLTGTSTAIEENQDVWATFHNTRIRLFVDDKLIIENGQKLSDRHINFAQAILRAQFPQCEGLQNTLLQDRLRWKATSNVVQIIHVRSDHWVVISNLFCPNGNVRVYDTVFNDIDDSTMSLLNSMFSKNITVTLAPLQKQQGSVDCGVFSIAIATSLLHSLIPGPYTQSLLRPHLIQCIESKSMLPFS